MHVIWVHIWALLREKYKSDHYLESKIKAKHRADDSGGIRENRQRKGTESDHSSGGFAPAVSLWLQDLWLTAEELCTRLHGTKGTQDCSWDRDKKKPPKPDPTHTHALPLPAPLPSPPSSLHRIIPLTLSQGLFFVVVNSTSMEFERLVYRKEGGKGDNKPPSHYSFFHWSCNHPNAHFSEWPPQVCWWNPYYSSLKCDCLPLHLNSSHITK